jgi:hypothetical protein
MHHAILDEQIGIDDTSGVDEDGAIVGNGDFDVLTVQGRQASIAERCAVADGPWHNMILQDTNQVFACQAFARSCNLLEGVVVWDEDGYVFCFVECGDKIELGGCSG